MDKHPFYSICVRFVWMHVHTQRAIHTHTGLSSLFDILAHTIHGIRIYTEEKGEKNWNELKVKNSEQFEYDSFSKGKRYLCIMKHFSFFNFYCITRFNDAYKEILCSFL